MCNFWSEFGACFDETRISWSGESTNISGYQSLQFGVKMSGGNVGEAQILKDCENIAEGHRETDHNDNIPSTSRTSPQGTSKGCKNVIQLNDTKAGMQGLDVESINTIINDASKGSKFYEHKLKQQKEIERKIQDMKNKLKMFSESQIHHAEAEMDRFGEQMERSRDYSRFIVHIDMDAFYASVEMRDDPSLRDKPMAVGSDRMLSTSNYIARRFGVRAAMPGFIAKKLCPGLIIVPCNFDKYREVSKEVQSILKEYDPDFSCVSLDEAYLDITNSVIKSQKSPDDLVAEMRARIFEKTQLTASAGIASNGFLAKICGDICKPNNQFSLPKIKEAEEEFVKKLPIRKVNGIGGVTEQLLRGLDVNTCEEIWQKRGLIALLFKPLTAKWLIRVSKGFQEPWGSDHDDHSGRKSMSCERTLEKGTSDVSFMLSEMEKLAEELAVDLQKREMRCKSVAIKIKTVDFDVKTRQTNIQNFTSKASDIFHAAKTLLENYLREEKGNASLRLLGIRVSKWDRQDGETDDEPLAKQPKISDAFAKVPKVQKPALTFHCPICNESFASERAVEVHIDSCLGSAKEVTEDKGERTEKVKTENRPSFTCPVCQNEIESLVEDVIVASSDHVNYCISADEGLDVEPTDHGTTWQLRLSG